MAAARGTGVRSQEGLSQGTEARFSRRYMCIGGQAHFLKWRHMEVFLRGEEMGKAVSKV